MKKLLLVFCLGAALSAARAADSVKINEVLRDVQSCYREEGETYCDLGQVNSGRVSARVTIPGLSEVAFGPDTWIGFRIGGLDLHTTLSEADSFSSTRALIRLFEEYEVETRDGDFITRLRRIGTITFSRSRNTLIINASFSRLISSIVAESGGWDEETGRGQTTIDATVGSSTATKNVDYVARVTTRASRDSEAEPLRTVTINGQADFKPPTVKILSPRNRATINSGVATVEGTAKDNVGVGEIQLRVGEDDWFTADLTAYGPFIQWSAQVPLAPGTNVVQVKSLDYESQESKIATRVIIRPPVE